MAQLSTLWNQSKFSFRNGNGLLSNRLTAFVRGDYEDAEADHCDAPTTATISGNVEAREWDYERLGNWSSVKTQINGLSSTESRSDTTFNKYYNVGGTTQTHDNNGNLTSGTQHQYVWSDKADFHCDRHLEDCVFKLGLNLFEDAAEYKIYIDWRSSSSWEHEKRVKYLSGWPKDPTPPLPF